MKKIFTLFAGLFFTAVHVYSQDVVLPKDEFGNYAFYEVVEIEGYSQEMLLKNANEFLKYYVNKRHRKTIVVNKEYGEVSARSSFLVYKRGSLGRNVDGSIAYSIKIEVKEGKYRYFISDLVFQEYERNRYGKFQPVSGKYRPLELPISDLNKGQWNDHKKTVMEKMDVFTGELKLNMLKTAEKSHQKVKVSDDW